MCMLKFLKFSLYCSYVADFEREVLRLLREINARAENALCALASLKLHLLPNEKVLKKPKGMPTIPLGSLELVQTMEQFLEDDDNLAYTVSNFSLKID